MAPNVHLATVLPPHAPRSTPNQRGEVVRRTSPAGYCLPPTADLSKSERGSISTSGPTISVCHQTGRLLQRNRSVSSPLAAAQPLNILSRPETLNASGSRRACRMAISCNACSLPDFPEFAQAVRYGVPGTPPRTGAELTRNPMGTADVWRMIRRRIKQTPIRTKVGCHSFRATGITCYLENKGTLEKAQQMASHSSPRTTKLYDRTNDQITLDEVEKIVI